MTYSNQITLEERLVVAFGAAAFSAPVIFLIWFGLNVALRYQNNGTEQLMGYNVFIYGVIAMAIIGFLLPRHVPNVIGELWNKFLRWSRWMGW